MPKTHYVYSTSSSDVAYTVFGPRKSGGPARPKHRVVIKGGANVASRRGLVTPLGIRTEVTDEQLELLKECPHFKRHQEKGFVKVMAGRYDGDEVADGMTKADRSAPKKPSDFEKEKQPDTGAPKK